MKGRKSIKAPAQYRASASTNDNLTYLQIVNVNVNTSAGTEDRIIFSLHRNNSFDIRDGDNVDGVMMMMMMLILHTFFVSQQPNHKGIDIRKARSFEKMLHSLMLV